MEVYAAYRSVPDYHAGPAPLHSLHTTLEGAMKGLYPTGAKFTKWPDKEVWEGPDGFGLIKIMEVRED